MDWGKLLNAGLEIANTVAEAQNDAKQVEGKDVAEKVDTQTAAGVADDLLTSLAKRTDNNIDDTLVALVKGTMHVDNIDDLILTYLESLAKQSNNSVDDTIVKLVKCYLKNCKDL